MASSTSGSPSSKSGAVATGLAVAILLLLVAVVIGISFLPSPYYALAEVVIYAGLVAAVAVKLRSCFRLAQGSEYAKSLHVIVFWVVLGVLAVVARLGDIFSTENRDYIRMATSGAVYLALLYALRLVEQLLQQETAANPAAAEATAAGAHGESLTP